MVMKLPEYCCFEAKKEFFSNYERINTIDDFKNKVLILKEDEKLIYRGMPEAKWQLFTSAQREYLCGDYKTLGIEFSDFIQSILSNIKESTIITKYLQSINLSPNDIFYLSLLQHYGAPSPLLDFTKDFETALYFAINGDSSIDKWKHEIDDFFSIYYFEKDERFYANYNLQDSSCKSFKKAEKFELKERISSLPNDCVLWEKMKNINFVILDDIEALKDKPGYFYWPNLNLIAQNGCFIMYTKEPQPLEQLLREIHFLVPFHCFDIHKSLIETIRTHYCKKTKEDLFPTMDRECTEAYNQFKQNLK